MCHKAQLIDKKSCSKALATRLKRLVSCINLQTVASIYLRSKRKRMIKVCNASERSTNDFKRKELTLRHLRRKNVKRFSEYLL